MVRGKVKKITYEPSRLTAVVQGSQDYMVQVQHNGRKIQSFTCDCPYYQNWGIMCKHVVAALETAVLETETADNDEIEQNKRRFAKKEFLQGMAAVNIKSAQNFVKIQPVVEIDKTNYGYMIYLSLKIGMDRMYVIKDMGDFFAHMKEGKSIAFGKQFVFRPATFAFAPDTAGLMEYLQLLYTVRSKQSMGRKMLIDEAHKRKFFRNWQKQKKWKSI